LSTLKVQEMGGPRLRWFVTACRTTHGEEAMPSRHSLIGIVRRCSSRCFSAAALLLLALGCSDADSPTEPGIAGSPEAMSSPDADPQFAIATNTWTFRRDMPGERFGVAAATVSNAAGQSILYAIGGNSATGGSLSRVQAYNVATNTWSYKAPLPGPLKSLNGAAVIDGKIYVPGGHVGGDNFSSKLYVYDPTANRWTEKQMPEEGSRGFSGVIQRKLYVVMYCPDFDICAFPQRWLLRYDPVTDHWDYLATPPRESADVGGTIGNKFYVGNSFKDPNVLDVYDPTTDTWTQKTTNLAVRNGAASVVLGARLYMIGGNRCADGSCTAVRTTNVYDPGTNRWTNLAPLPRTRPGASAARVFLGGRARIELVGGTLPGNNLQYTP
jgi:hypothetical protein